MSYKLTKKEINEMEDIELIRQFEIVVAETVKEANTRGVTLVTHKSYTLLKEEIRNRFKIEKNYDNCYEELK